MSPRSARLRNRALLSAGLASALLAMSPAAFAADAASDDVVARDAYSTTTREGDEFRTRAFPEPVNFQEADGSWEPIDRSLVRESDGTVHPAAVDGDASIPTSIAHPVVIEHDGRQLSFDLRGASGGRELGATKAKFDEALDGVDVAYKVRGNGLKETLTLAGPEAQRTFVYDVTGAADLEAEVGPDGQLIFKDASGKERFRVAAPLAWDSAEPKAYADALELSITKVSAGRWTVTLKADDEWLDDPARVYPVTLDPDYYWVDSALRFHGANLDAYVAGGSHAGTPFAAANVLQVGYTNNRPYKSLLKFDVASAIPKYATATEATFLLWQPQSTPKNPANMRLRTVTKDWNSTVTWDVAKTNQPWTTGGGDVSTDPNLVGPPTTVGAQNYWYYWDAPLAAVNGWIKGTLPNYGLQLSTDAGAPPTTAYVFTSTEGDQALWPALDVTWTPDTTAPTGVVPAPGDDGATDQDDLAGAYAGTINASAQDDLAGVKKLELLRDADIVVATANVACPNDVCPLNAGAALSYNTTGWSDGAHTFKLRATDGAGNVTTTSAWNVFVDRTAPVVTTSPYISKNGDEAWLSWDTNDAPNGDGSGGSGVAVDAVRILQSGTWTAWTDTTDSTFTVPDSSTSLTVQLRTTDGVGNQYLAPQSTATVRPLTGTPNTNSVTLPTFDCAAEFGPGVCVDPEDDESAATFSALAAAPNPYKATYDAKPKWGFADPDSPFISTTPTANPYTASATVNEIRQGHAISSQRILVPYNIADETAPNQLKFPGRYGNLVKQLKAAQNANIPVLLTFESGCTTDAPDKIGCSKTGAQDRDTAPIGNELNRAALRILRVRDGFTTTGQQVGKAIKWISVWNEPFFSLQPFRDKTEAGQTGTNKPNDGETGLREITKDLADPQDGACKQVRWCQLVAPEVTFSLTASSANPSAYRYAEWITRQYRRTTDDNPNTTSVVDFNRLKFYGAHPYAEIENAWNKENPPWKTSALARYMGRLPRNANVWLAETGVFAKPIGQTGVPNGVYSVDARKKQAAFLFDRLGRLKLGTNGARIARANYYTVCAGAVASAETPVPFDTSLHDGQYNGAGTNCTAGLTKRDDVVDAFKRALKRAYPE